jgi:fructan beta-fructosidase
MKTKRIIFAGLFCCGIAAALASCASCSSEDNNQEGNTLIENPQGQESTPDGGKVGRHEQFRPQIHFTPAKNWMNDPNGMVYADGIYHLFYQYNPKGNDWGNMSWGHATSTDLFHWTEQSVALTRDELGDIFSGSAVIDKQNTAGFGANAMVAIYTSATEKQQQSIAYSTDGGKTFTRYNANPVIKNDDDNLRDPKVFWHEESSQWIMCLAKGWKMGIEIYGSKDLKSWQHLSTFVTDLKGRPSLQWECPDLIRMGEKWVLLVSVNPGGPILGSGTMYLVGQFDGKEFKAESLDYPIWIDYGMDNYAGVTWSNTGNRRILLGWMNNWEYAGSVPCSPWRSAMTLPRELKLTMYDGKPLLCCPVVSEIDKIAGEWKTVDNTELPLTTKEDAYQLRLTISLDKNSTITLSNGKDEKYVLDINASDKTLTAHRTAQTGRADFSGKFSVPSMHAPLNVTGDKVTLDLYVDQSSVETLTKDGTMSMTNLVFPQTIYDRLTVTGAKCEAQIRMLNSVWK